MQTPDKDGWVLTGDPERLKRLRGLVSRADMTESLWSRMVHDAFVYWAAKKLDKDENAPSEPAN